MSEKSERLRTGMAMLESIARQLEQTCTELGGNKTELQAARLAAITEGVRQLATSFVAPYDKARKP